MKGHPDSRMPISLDDCVSGACPLKLTLSPPTNVWTEAGILRLNLVAESVGGSGFRACPVAPNITMAAPSLNVSVNGVRLQLVSNAPSDPAGWSSWPDSSFASFRVPVAALREGSNTVSLHAPPPASERSYVMVHSGRGDGKRFHFPYPYTASSWTGARINGSAHPGLSLIDCEAQCDAVSACEGLYYGPGPGDQTCYTLDTLVIGRTSLSGVSYKKTKALSGSDGGRDVATQASAADLTLIYLDLSLPGAGGETSLSLKGG